jgi:hypothetical protein
MPTPLDRDDEEQNVAELAEFAENCNDILRKLGPLRPLRLNQFFS